MNHTIWQQVRPCLPPPPAAWPPSARLEHDLRLDSLERLELVLLLEHKLRVRIPDAGLDHLQTLADLAGSLERQQRASSISRFIQLLAAGC